MNFRTAGAAAYQTGQTGYAVTPTAATAATYTAQRAGTGYETAYQTAATHTTAGTYAGNLSFLVVWMACRGTQFVALDSFFNRIYFFCFFVYCILCWHVQITFIV